MIAVQCSCGKRTLRASERKLLRQVDALLTQDGAGSGALIPILQKTQALFGYLPEPALEHISLKLGMPYSEVAGVVGFYSFFTTVPRGRHLIRVCLGTACYVRGGRRVLEAIERKLGIKVGETTPDRQFTLEIARCFGACGLAPVIMIDSDIHQRVKPAKVESILAQYAGKKRVAREAAK
ncbi:MAG: NAD(P)H-dependent oxidoreductase subunit E [Kiritimatiellae bacterium]|nr:NAD(P)H-dependent oxidoreductase subunit E [Kiritimatiellia bacterium]